MRLPGDGAAAHFAADAASDEEIGAEEHGDEDHAERVLRHQERLGARADRLVDVVDLGLRRLGDLRLARHALEGLQGGARALRPDVDLRDLPEEEEREGQADHRAEVDEGARVSHGDGTEEEDEGARRSGNKGLSGFLLLAQQRSIDGGKKLESSIRASILVLWTFKIVSISLHLCSSIISFLLVFLTHQTTIRQE